MTRAFLNWLLGIFRRREHLPAPDKRCERAQDWKRHALERRS